jgi:hypothetical protein
MSDNAIYWRDPLTARTYKSSSRCRLVATLLSGDDVEMRRSQGDEPWLRRK